jgi:hypothetical protein
MTRKQTLYKKRPNPRIEKRLATNCCEILMAPMQVSFHLISAVTTQKTIRNMTTTDLNEVIEQDMAGIINSIGKDNHAAEVPINYICNKSGAVEGDNCNSSHGKDRTKQLPQCHEVNILAST